MDLKALDAELPEYWKDGPADDNFNSQPTPHRHFSHALAHAMKAMGKLAALSDALDHAQMQKHGYADPELGAALLEAPKLLADLVICATRMAQKLPAPVDLSKAVDERAAVVRARWAR